MQDSELWKSQQNEKQATCHLPSVFIDSTYDKDDENGWCFLF